MSTEKLTREERERLVNHVKDIVADLDEQSPGWESVMFDREDITDFLAIAEDYEKLKEENERLRKELTWAAKLLYRECIITRSRGMEWMIEVAPYNRGLNPHIPMIARGRTEMEAWQKYFDVFAPLPSTANIKEAIRNLKARGYRAVKAQTEEVNDDD